MTRPTKNKLPGIPRFDELLAPTLEALDKLGGSASIYELVDEIAKILNLSDEQLSFRRDNAQTNEVAYRAAWARTYLRHDGAIEATTRGTWTITPRGRNLIGKDLSDLPKRVRQKVAAAETSVQESPPAKSTGAQDSIELPGENETALDWKEHLLLALKTMPAASFERLSQRILREKGFTKVEVTGKAGDEGIDGVGVLRIGLISFPILFQCKRYKENVGPDVIRNFRGAMQGRSDKGLVITTGRFTQGARAEATRDGAPPIELIDGEALCDLLKELQIGVRIEMVERVHVDITIFKDL